jgi:octaprenyl-diphosphate synthase
MTTTLPDVAPTHHDVFDNLEGVCAGRGLDSLAGRLVELRAWLEGDLAEVERALRSAGTGDEPAHKAARHLLDQEGKRLRPICVALAARAGAGFTPAARVYAVAVELVHAATLLHDDVVDVGDLRRGSPAARVIYGNAASIFGGDWLLIDALCRIQSTGQPEVLERVLDVVKQMVVAESLQLARRGRVRGGQAEYFRIIDGKTASLFRWAMFAGARAGGVDADATAALEGYGQKLGVAFQLVDDLLDVAGDPSATGKSLLADLREGKMTYPLILAMERDPELVPLLDRFCAAEAVAGDGPGGERPPPVDPELLGRLSRAMTSAGVTEDCLALSTRLCRDAVRSLAALPPSRARAALESVALSVPRRRK